VTVDFEGALGHNFADGALLDAALIHRSHTAEHPDEPDNERLEFLGDAVLQLVVTDYLYANHGGLREGQMAKVRAACVNRDELAAIARTIGLGDRIRLGVGEQQSGGREKSSILADTMEAVIAAVYLDAGLEAARSCVLGLWTDLIETKAVSPGRRDFKTRLQEALAAEGRRPVYVVVGTGPDHARRFEARVEVDGTIMGVGQGRSKKEAEQQAARVAIEAR
jgi:ribonuclease III